jgi:membrane associated rhomboid family serine protease
MSPASREMSDSERRIAWVSYGLALACLVGFFFAKAAALEVRAVSEKQLASAEEYFEEHPYLEPPLLLERRITRETAHRLQQRSRDQRQRRSAPPIPRRIQHREQRELEAIVAAAADRIDGLPGQRWGLRPTERVPETFLTHLFFHAGWPHVLGNLLLLLLIGYFLEGVWGSGLFAFVASASALGAAGIFVARNPAFPEPLIGISGLVSGLLGAFIVRFGRARGQVPYALAILLGGLVLALPLWFGLEWSIARGVHAPPPEAGPWNVSSWALAGGLVSGTLACFAIRLIGLEGTLRKAQVAAEIRRGAANPQLERALQERSEGNLDEAFNILTGILRREPDSLDASLALWDVANDLERPGAATQAILRVIRDEVQRGDRYSAVKHWLEVVECGLDADAEPALLIRMATLLRDSGEWQAATRSLRNALLRSEGPGSTAVASRVAREASELDPETAANAAWRALRSLDLDFQERQSLEGLLAELQPRLEHSDVSTETPAFEPEATVSAADLIAPSDGLEEQRVPDTRPDLIEIDESSRPLEAVMAIPTDFDSEGVVVEVEGGVKKRVRFDRIEAVSVAAVDGLAPKTVLLVDLVLNWMSLTAESLKVVRLRGDRFDPRRLIPDRDEPLEALRAFVERVLQESDATPLPDLQSARGMPFAAFESLDAYHRDVLMVDVEN